MKRQHLVIYLVFLILFIIYLVKADYIFNILIPTQHQATLVEKSLPQAEGQIHVEFEEARVMEQKWKKILYVRGWTALEPTMDSTGISLVLFNNETNFIYTTPEDKIINRVLAIPQERFEKSVIMGFEFYIPIYKLPTDTLHLGLLFEGEGYQYFIKSEKDYLEWGDGLYNHKKKENI